MASIALELLQPMLRQAITQRGIYRKIPQVSW
jgi:hypothetical protein